MAHLARLQPCLPSHDPLLREFLGDQDAVSSFSSPSPDLSFQEPQQCSVFYTRCVFAPGPTREWMDTHDKKIFSRHEKTGK